MEYKLKVIEPYIGIKYYINAVLGNESRDMSALWLKYAIEPFWNDWAAGQFNEQRSRADLSGPVTEVGKLKKSIEELENALTTEQEYQQWNTLQEYLSREDNMELHHRFFFGDIKTGTPAFTGYTIGFKIMQKYLSFYPEIIWETLPEMDPWELFQKSGYFFV